MYVVMRLDKWEDMTCTVNLPIPVGKMVAPFPGAIGVLHVFATREDAEREFPGAQIVMATIGPKEQP